MQGNWQSFTLKFTYSKSKNYRQALEIANKLGGKMEAGVMNVSIKDFELMNAYEKLLPLLEIIDKWKGVSAIYNNKPIHPFRFVFQVWRSVAECAEKRNSTWNERHCWQNIDQQGWGCKLLNPFARHLGTNKKPILLTDRLLQFKGEQKEEHSGVFFFLFLFFNLLGQLRKKQLCDNSKSPH